MYGFCLKLARVLTGVYQGFKGMFGSKENGEVVLNSRKLIKNVF